MDVTTYVAGYNFTTDMNQISLNLGAEELDNTTFGSGGWRTRVAGLKDVEAELAGYWQAGSPSLDSEAFTRLGLADEVVSMSPTGVEGDTAYVWRGEKFGYDAFGSIGELTPFSLSMKGSHGQGAARGTFLKTRANVSATGATGTSFRIIGGIPSGFALYSSFHVFTAGTTITALVESDDANTFASATTRLTHGPITAVGGTIQRIAGPITDDWFRVRVSAITGTFSIACAIGVGV
ncbi:hypothetical protein ACIBI9_31325 [Nonomuraea sp. NPDC050451]|uniref:hypothetical protein n=1 Tax=Nonomuraea sp. NPDC050451 TaxID=3364364 RepID=UPI0037ADB015